MPVQQFNIRVYGVLIWEHQVLLSDEFIRGAFITKFPGGGLELGEGTRDCLKREFFEETGLQVEVKDHLYTTDFYQASAFNPTHQIISIYYLVDAFEPEKLITQTQPFQFDPYQIENPNGEAEVFRWKSIHQLSQEDVTLPIDKVVVNIITKNY